MPFYGPTYADDGHASYEVTPYARPESVEVLEGGIGFDPVAAIGALRIKRLPWEISPDLHRDELLAGGAFFPAGTYRFTLENPIRAPASLDGLPYFAFPFMTWLYLAERRAHAYGALDAAPFTWAGFPPYHHSATEQWSVTASLWMGAMNDSADWEANGLRVSVRFMSDTRVLALVSRAAWYWEATYIPDVNAFLQDAVNVNGFVFKQAAGEGWGIWANDGPH